jgi:hypothetical protein
MNICESENEMFLYSYMLNFFYLCLVRFASPQTDIVDFNMKHYLPYINIPYE